MDKMYSIKVKGIYTVKGHAVPVEYAAGWDAALDAVQAARAQPAERDVSDQISKWKQVDGDMRESGGLITYHVDAFNEGMRAAQPAGEAVALTDQQIEDMWWGELDNRSLGCIRNILKAARAQPACPHCDGTGDVHSPDGEWRGVCTCEAGKAIKPQPAGEPVACQKVIDSIEHCPADENPSCSYADGWNECIRFIRGRIAYERTITPPAKVPMFVRKRIERAISEAVNPKGMSVHDGMARVPACDLQMLLNGTVHIPEQPAQVPDGLREAAKDFYNRTVGDKDVIIRCNSAEKRDDITASGERLRDILTHPPKGIKND